MMVQDTLYPDVTRRRIELGPEGAGGFAVIAFGDISRPVGTLFLPAKGLSGGTPPYGSKHISPNEVGVSTVAVARREWMKRARGGSRSDRA